MALVRSPERIYKTNLLTKFRDDWAKNVTSRVHVIQLTGTIFELNSHTYIGSRGSSLIDYVLVMPECDYKKTLRKCRLEYDNKQSKLLDTKRETNVLTKFHENWAKNVTSRVFTCFHYIHIEKNAPPTGGHVFSPIWTIFELVRDINKTNVLTNFHDDWAKIVTS
ncbi:hypothetical protein DPMN_151195 [Dreissena polymorpha]|uniref:Uncharacterized protein n=1 Tax=Dreissena polymorpha TaxID=45954 RepID=A0A9D4FGP4_DREPO|nr:hypothetical protein DPMN_151195 [Dreissena polymorpha]